MQRASLSYEGKAMRRPYRRHLRPRSVRHRSALRARTSASPGPPGSPTQPRRPRPPNGSIRLQDALATRDVSVPNATRAHLPRRRARRRYRFWDEPSDPLRNCRSVKYGRTAETARCAAVVLSDRFPVDEFRTGNWDRVHDSCHIRHDVWRAPNRSCVVK